MPEVFNYLGIYLTQAGNFDAAYEAFDSVLELDPTYNYAHLNRGIALYYGGANGYGERDAVMTWLETLDDRKFSVLRCDWANRRNDPPVPIFIWKE